MFRVLARHALLRTRRLLPVVVAGRPLTTSVASLTRSMSLLPSPSPCFRSYATEDEKDPEVDDVQPMVDFVDFVPMPTEDAVQRVLEDLDLVSMPAEDPLNEESKEADEVIFPGLRNMLAEVDPAVGGGNEVQQELRPNEEVQALVETVLSGEEAEEDEDKWELAKKYEMPPLTTISKKGLRMQLMYNVVFFSYPLKSLWEDTGLPLPASSGKYDDYPLERYHPTSIKIDEGGFPIPATKHMNDFAKVFQMRMPLRDLERLMEDLKTKTGCRMTLVTIKHFSDFPDASVDLRIIGERLTSRRLWWFEKQEAVGFRNFCRGLFRAWDVGGQDERGILLVVSLKDRRAAMVVGEGHSREMVRTATLIIEDVVLRRFQKRTRGSFANGVKRGVEAAVVAFGNEDTALTTRRTTRSIRIAFVLLLVIAILWWCRRTFSVIVPSSSEEFQSAGTKMKAGTKSVIKPSM